MMDPAELDPGIRDVVEALWAKRVRTTDSGDGVSKPPSPGVLPYPHVAIDPGRSPRTTSRKVVAVLQELRPGEVWQVDFTRSVTTQGPRREVPAMVAYRLER